MNNNHITVYRNVTRQTRLIFEVYHDTMLGKRLILLENVFSISKGNILY
jgi:hypothetical protein